MTITPELEAVARAIHTARTIAWFHEDPSKCEKSLAMARAALLAIREPTDRMSSAAPEMLEALELLIQHEPVQEDFGPLPRHDLRFASAVEDFRKARAAIAKAKGETL